MPPSEELKRPTEAGPVSVGRLENKIEIVVEENGESMRIVASEWNARRVLGALSLILGLPLTKQSQKKITMG